MANINKLSGVRYREAGEDTWRIVEGISDPEKRQRYVEFLREKEWVVFKPRPVDFERFADLLKKNPELRAWIESADARLIAERLVREYWQIFVSIDHAYEIEVDWKIRRAKLRPRGGSGRGDPAPIPTDLLTTLSDDELSIVARQMLRQEVKALNRDPQAAIAAMREKARREPNDKRRRLYDFLRQYMKELVELKFPHFVTELTKNGESHVFPSMHVRIWYQQILERGNALIVGDVGTQKTSAAVVGLDGLGAQRIVVVCRSYARESVWDKDVGSYFRAKHEPITVGGCGDIGFIENMSQDDFRRHRFIVVGYGNVQSNAHGENGDKNGDRLVAAIARLKPDAVVIDEAHAINHPGTRSDRVLRVARLPSVRNRIMLTATPFENHANEVARVATLLDPKHFPGEEIFHSLCRDNPRIFFGVMARRMCDYFSQEDVLDLPEANYSPLNMLPKVELECPPDLKTVHAAIQNDGKLSPGEQVFRMARLLTVPYVGRSWYSDLGDLPIFSDPMRNPKLQYLRAEVRRRIRNGKVVIASGIYASGITRSLEDADHDPDLYEIASLFERWFPGKVVRYDAQATNGNGGRRRKAIVDRWQNDPNARILIVAVPAAAESISFTLRRSATVKLLTIFHLTLPWKPTQYMQFNGRYRRPGMELPIESLSLLVKGTADEALLELNEKKWRNFLIGVHGMPILAEEEKAIEKATFAKLRTTPARWLRDAFARMLAMGEEANRRFLDGTLDGSEIAKTMAEYYLAVEDYGTSGHVARFMVPSIRQWRETDAIRRWEDILDAACGPLVLERRLDGPVCAIDMNRPMLDAGREHSYHGGKNARVGYLSKLPKEWTEKFSMVALSLALHLSSSRKPKDGKEVERVRILRQLNRVMKDDGLLWCAVPGFCFNEASLDAFLGLMPNFGFEVVEPLSGCVTSLDHPKHPFKFWSILLRKHGAPEQGMLDPPLFAFERTFEGRVKGKGVKGKKRGSEPEPIGVRHERFSITDRFGVVHDPLVAAGTVVGKEREMRRLYEALSTFIGLGKKDDLVALRLRKELFRATPGSWTQLKEIWKRIKEMDGAPKVEWAKLQRFAVSFFAAQR